jgi:ribosomal protein S21
LSLQCKVQAEDTIKEVKRHSYYVKPGEKKRVKQALAQNARESLANNSQTDKRNGLFLCTPNATHELPPSGISAWLQVIGREPF